MALVPALLSFCGCDAGGLIEISVYPDGQGGGDTTSHTASTGSTSTGATTTGTPNPNGQVVLFGITPTPAAPSAAEALAADLTTFGAGVRASTIVVRWSDLVAESGGDALAKRSAFYAKYNRRVLVNIAVVDRLVDHRPADVAGQTWSSPQAIAEMKEAIDIVFETTGPELRFLTVGRDVDVYLANHDDERTAFLGFAKEASAYARNHADAPDDLQVGVAFSQNAKDGEPLFHSLLDLGEVAVLSYFQGISTFAPTTEAGPAVAIADWVDEVGEKKIVLQASGFATDPTAGGSEADQEAFFAALFGSVVAHRGNFALVNVTELYDPAKEACGAWAEAQSGTDTDKLTAYACSLGLWRADGTAKPSWGAVLKGAATLSSP